MLKMDNEKEMQAMFDAAKSKSLKEDMRRVKSASQNPFYHNGKTDLDAYIKFLNAYNVFINHKPKPFKPMICNNLKL